VCVWTEVTTRHAVHGRSDWICELCRRARATDMHHRKSAGTGGEWRPVNMLHLCRLCHSYHTDHPAVAYSRGVSLKRGDNPETTPVVRDNGEMFQPTDNIMNGQL
jgi:hypothetical protein